MAKHITRYDENKIMDLINTWPKDDKLTWDVLCDKLVKVIHKRPSRQSLSSHARIAECFNLKKANIKSGELHIVKPANFNVACQRIKRLESENESLRAINNKYMEQFKVWLYNAHLKQITIEDLNNPLPKKFFE